MSGSFIVPLEVEKSYRVLNIGPTVLVSAACDGVDDIMTAAWACALDFDKVCVVIDKSHFTRRLMERGEYFALQVPLKGIAGIVMNLGTVSKNDEPGKIERSGCKTFKVEGYDLPLVEGCGAWLVCRRLAEPRNEELYDLFIGKVVAAYADERILKDGHWLFESAPDRMRTLHYVAGGRFYAIGEALDID